MPPNFEELWIGPTLASVPASFWLTPMQGWRRGGHLPAQSEKERVQGVRKEGVFASTIGEGAGARRTCKEYGGAGICQHKRTGYKELVQGL